MNHAKLMQFSLLVLLITTGFYVFDNVFLFVTRDGILSWVAQASGLGRDISYGLSRLIRFFFYLGLFGFFYAYRHKS